MKKFMIVLVLFTGCAAKTKKSSLVFENRIPFQKIPIFYTEVVIGDSEFNIAQKPQETTKR